MLATIENRRILTIQIEKSELVNIINGAEITKHIKDSKDSESDDALKYEINIYCPNPDQKKIVEDE